MIRLPLLSGAQCCSKNICIGDTEAKAKLCIVGKGAGWRILRHMSAILLPLYSLALQIMPKVLQQKWHLDISLTVLRVLVSLPALQAIYTYSMCPSIYFSNRNKVIQKIALHSATGSVLSSGQSLVLSSSNSPIVSSSKESFLSRHKDSIPCIGKGSILSCIECCISGHSKGFNSDQQ